MRTDTQIDENRSSGHWEEIIEARKGRRRKGQGQNEVRQSAAVMRFDNGGLYYSATSKSSWAGRGLSAAKVLAT